MVSAAGSFPKIDGDKLYAADGFTATRPNGRLFGYDAGSTLTMDDTTTISIGSFTGVFTIPANTVSQALLVQGTFRWVVYDPGDNSSGTGSVCILAGTTNPPTTIKKWMYYKFSDSGSFCTSLNHTIDDLTFSSTNYVQVQLRNGAGGNAGDDFSIRCDGVSVMGF